MREGDRRRGVADASVSADVMAQCARDVAWRVTRSETGALFAGQLRPLQARLAPSARCDTSHRYRFLGIGQRQRECLPGCALVSHNSWGPVAKPGAGQPRAQGLRALGRHYRRGLPLGGDRPSAQPVLVRGLAIPHNRPRDFRLQSARGALRGRRLGLHAHRHIVRRLHCRRLNRARFGPHRGCELGHRGDPPRGPLRDAGVLLATRT
mmetsp:Transcript_11297/g.47175  ORF Transcript_11297/g.47175 Transcript_11297/m.47175 type:complete len:208 (+) Transcript_11297:2156-2779(+)